MQEITRESWLIYPLRRADQREHIERAEQLLAEVCPGDPPTLYWSMADRPGIVLGFSQKSSLLHSAAPPLPIYHRRAGGTAVLVGPDLLDLDVILPADHPLVLADIVESYRWFGEAWVETLRRLGIETRTGPPAEAHRQRARRKDPTTREYELLLHRSCYGTLSPYEVVVGQRKVVGFDMIRRRAGSLLQAGVLLHWDTEVLAGVLGQSEEEQALLRSGLAERAIGLDLLSPHLIGIKEIISTFEQVVVSQSKQL